MGLTDWFIAGHGAVWNALSWLAGAAIAVVEAGIVSGFAVWFAVEAFRFIDRQINR